MSFKEQLLKAGLVTEDQVKATEAAERKEKEQRRQKRQAAEQQRAKPKGKSPKGKSGTTTRSNNKSSGTKQSKLDDIAYRPSKNPKKAAKSGTAARKAQLTSIKYLIKKHRMNTEAADQDYNFVSSNKIRKVRVTVAQSKALANGKLVLLRNPQDSFDYPILPIPIALEIAETERHVILVWNGSEGDKYWAAEEAAKAANQATQQAQKEDSADSTSTEASPSETTEATETATVEAVALSASEPAANAATEQAAVVVADSALEGVDALTDADQSSTEQGAV